jgi:hypothetical protein
VKESEHDRTAAQPVIVSLNRMTATPASRRGERVAGAPERAEEAQPDDPRSRATSVETAAT